MEVGVNGRIWSHMQLVYKFLVRLDMTVRGTGAIWAVWAGLGALCGAAHGIFLA